MKVASGRVRRRRRVPTVTQVSQTECGLCCCSAIMRYHGRYEDLSTIRRELEAGRDGVSVRRLATFLRARGMEVKVARFGDVAALETVSSPVILHWTGHHFVVLERFDGKHAELMDPAVGRRRVTRAELASSVTGIVLFVTPTPKFQTRRKRFLEEWRATRLLADGSRRRMAMVALFSLGGYGAVIGVPALTEWAVDHVHEFSDLDGLTLVCAVIVGVAVAYFGIQLIRVTILSSLVALLGRHLMTSTFGKLLTLPYSFFATRQSGELLHRLGMVNSIRDMLSSRIAQGVLDIGTLLCLTVYLFVVEWRIGLLVVAMLLANAAYLVARRDRVREVVDTELTQLGKSQSIQLDAIVSIPTIKMGGYTEEFVKDWAETYDASLRAMRTRMRLQQGWVTGVTTAVQMFGPLVVLLVSLYLVNHGHITIGAAIAVQAISATYYGMASSVFLTSIEFAEASRYMARLKDILATPSEPVGGTLSAPPTASISLEGVSFRYSGHDEPVVRDVSLEIPAGAKVALVGKSGSGKSTLGKIICGLYAPSEGTVRYGGQPREAYALESLRRNIGYVPQEVHLHNRTILENLTLGQNVPLEQVVEYCETVGILDFLKTLPLGLDTVVSEMGANFSGGQRQRLAIVRALLQRPSILVLDEATASLDSINEAKVSQILAEMGATQVIIAHRLGTVRSADRIYVMDDGRVVEEGTHDELLKSAPIYRSLYQNDVELPDAVVTTQPV